MARPRSTDAHRAALDAAVDVLLEVGLDGLTLEEVAARSGVARSTLYRHFGSKEALLLSAVQGCLVEHPTPDTGSLDGDLRFLFERFTGTEEEHRIPELLTVLLHASGSDPELERLLRSALEERRRPLRTVLRLAQARGEIDPDLDLDDALALVIGPFIQRRMIDRREITPAFVDTVLRLTTAALRAAPVPG